MATQIAMNKGDLIICEKIEIEREEDEDHKN